MSALITPSLRAATAIRVWQRASIEWIAGVFGGRPEGNAEVDVAQVALRPDELELL